jgi:hypothetical protein
MFFSKFHYFQSILSSDVKNTHDLTMQITDLCYLQNVPEDDLILGSSGVSVTSKASALGSDKYTSISANTSAASFSTNDSKAYGRGLANAIGNDAKAEVGFTGYGDIVIAKTKSQLSKKTAVTSGFIIAIDLF